MRPASNTRAQFQFSYIFAFPETGAALECIDVTRRYCPDFDARNRKYRLHEDDDWFLQFKWLVTRSREAQDQAYIKEVKKLKKASVVDEKMPTTITGFTGHPMYVLN